MVRKKCVRQVNRALPTPNVMNELFTGLTGFVLLLIGLVAAICAIVAPVYVVIYTPKILALLEKIHFEAQQSRLAAWKENQKDKALR